MIESNEKVKFWVYTSQNLTNHSICSYETAKRVMDEIKNPAIDWLFWQGIVNDLDGNEIEFLVKRDEVVSASIIKANQL